MKKYICGAALSATLLTSSALASAAANPFSDVPADHWAYDAVAQLADDGVIEGYGDGTYRGQNEITRYEMAQMVAKAMAKEDQVNAQQKAMIDRLAAEFAEELGNLGVRVENLEQKADNVKWEGELRYVHLSHRDENAAGATDKHSVNTLQLRLLPVATVNDHWKVRARLTGSVKLSEDQASSGEQRRPELPLRRRQLRQSAHPGGQDVALLVVLRRRPRRRLVVLGRDLDLRHKDEDHGRRRSLEHGERRPQHLRQGQARRPHGLRLHGEALRHRHRPCDGQAAGGRRLPPL